MTAVDLVEDENFAAALGAEQLAFAVVAVALNGVTTPRTATDGEFQLHDRLHWTYSQRQYIFRREYFRI